MDRDTGIAQLLQTQTRHLRIGILYTVIDFADTGIYQRIRARRCAPHMCTGFQRHIHGGAARQLAGCIQCMGFSMGSTYTFVTALTHYFSVAHNHAANPRVGSRRQNGLRQFNGALHVIFGRHSVSSTYSSGPQGL